MSTEDKEWFDATHSEITLPDELNPDRNRELILDVLSNGFSFPKPKEEEATADKED